MGGKQSCDYGKIKQFGGDSSASISADPIRNGTRDENENETSSVAHSISMKKISSEQSTHSKELALAVAEANEHLFMENAKRSRHHLSVRSLFSTATSMSLSERQKAIIRSTWKLAIADGKLKPGVTIFQNIFRRCPDLKRLFHLSHVEDLDELPKEERFLRHANVFSDVIDLAVRNMEELDAQMAPALITLGRRHYYKHNVGFRPDYLAVFAQAMLDFLGADERFQLVGDKEAIDGWWMLTVYLVTKLQHGYALESMGKNQSGKFKLWHTGDPRAKRFA